MAREQEIFWSDAEAAASNGDGGFAILYQAWFVGLDLAVSVAATNQ